MTIITVHSTMSFNYYYIPSLAYIHTYYTHSHTHSRTYNSPTPHPPPHTHTPQSNRAEGNPYSSDIGILSMYGSVPSIVKRCHRCGSHGSHLASHFKRSVEDDRDTMLDEHYGSFESSQTGRGIFPARVLGAGESSSFSSKPLMSADNGGE